MLSPERRPKLCTVNKRRTAPTKTRTKQTQSRKIQPHGSESHGPLQMGLFRSQCVARVSRCRFRVADVRSCARSTRGEERQRRKESKREHKREIQTSRLGEPWPTADGSFPWPACRQSVVLSIPSVVVRSSGSCGSRHSGRGLPFGGTHCVVPGAGRALAAARTLDGGSPLSVRTALSMVDCRWSRSVVEGRGFGGKGDFGG
jgi:hypothetical protein